MNRVNASLVLGTAALLLLCCCVLNVTAQSSPIPLPPPPGGPPRRALQMRSGPRNFNVSAIRVLPPLNGQPGNPGPGHPGGPGNPGVSRNGSVVQFSADNIGFPDWGLTFFVSQVQATPPFGMRVVLLNAVEYTPDATPGYQPGADTVVSRYWFNDAARQWTDFQYARDVINENVTLLNATTTSADGRATLTFAFTTSQINNPVGPQMFRRAQLTPGSMKITFTLNYPWVQSSTALALRFGFISNSGFSSALNTSVPPNANGEPENDPQLRVGGSDGQAGFFSWNNTVWVNSNPYPVVVSQLAAGAFSQNVTLPPGTTAYEVFLSFENVPHNGPAMWDPALGYAGSDSTTSGAALTAVRPVTVWLTVLALLAAVLLGGTLV